MILVCFCIEWNKYFRMATPLTRAFILIGTQGSGKSATGNSIVGAKCFPSMSGTDPLTKEIKEKIWQWQERYITIIDTPPLNEQSDLTKVTTHARRKNININYGFVISIGRPLPIESVLLETISKNLDPKTEDMVLIFTRYDDLDSDKSFEDWLLSCPRLKAFIDKTNIKCFHFANKNGIKLVKDQVNDLMATIMGITKAVKHNESQAHVNLSNKVDTNKKHNESQAHVNLPGKVDTTKDSKHNQGQVHDKHSAKGKTTKKFKHAETQTGLKSKPKINDEILVSCQLLEEYFGKCGTLFYNEVLKNGTN